MQLTDIEKSIIKKYRKDIFSPFIKAIKEFDLINDNDSIAVCISGGKDSFLLAKCMQEIKKHGKVNFKLEFIVMNPGYNEANLNKIKDNLNLLNIEAHIFDAPIFSFVDTTDNPCYLCAKMRRGYLYEYASKLGCNKIALGHHFDDIIETVLLNVIYNGHFSSMMPKLKSTSHPNMELIRPLYYVKENSIISWKKYNNLDFLDCACSITKKEIGKRREIKNLIKDLNKMYDKADTNILTATKNVNLNTIISYKKGDETFNFKDNYK